MNTATAPDTANSRRSGIRAGKFLGIEFYLDPSWFILAALVIWTLATSYFPYKIPGHPDWWYFITGTVAAALFYLSLLLHELGHSVVSQRCGIPVPRITLMFIGGMAEIQKEPDDAHTELKIALGGPAVTVVLVLVFYGCSLAGDLLARPGLATVMSWLAASNLYLLLFNALPGYPLDGGRVLRALLWMRSGRLTRATYLSSRVGIALGWMLMILGVFTLFRAPLQAFVFFLIGSFLRNAASAGYENAVFRDTLGNVPVAQVMTSDPVVIPSSLPLNLAVDDFFLTSHHTAYPVADDHGSFAGILRIEQLTRVPREKWPYTTAGKLAAEFSGPEMTIDPEIKAIEAIAEMADEGRGRLVVVEQNRIVGFVTRHDILQFIHINQALPPRP